MEYLLIHPDIFCTLFVYNQLFCTYIFLYINIMETAKRDVISISKKNSFKEKIRDNIVSKVRMLYKEIFVL